VNEILKKADESRTTDDRLLLSQSEDIVEMIAKRARIKELARQRHLEVYTEFGVILVNVESRRLRSYVCSKI